ncbi:MULTISPECIES: hypothetical protein [unclassified Rhodococcus (in: high G+C Gram-positive bacteria)]|uniref:hypothetical protein n=1 Tax=unclassified Rhodococcus (in: high G+C Gram-positive bacteria) TaxID=192944 RepID=UPI00117A5206|nr:MULTISPECIES: hypothetical protein [unclassified Rhodococcus (in: high G+C Gram-positive bacteria)]
MQEVEGRILEQFIYDGVSLADANAMRRLPPVHRDLFDNFVFAATAVAVGESDWSRFPIASLGYMSAVHGDLTLVPPLIPPDAADVVADVLSRFTPFKSGDERVADGSRINEDQYRLAEELFTRLGGDRGDGARAAGARAHSRMMSARIADGFVHPVIGAHIWSDVPAAPRAHPGSGPEVTVLELVEGLLARWRQFPVERAGVERDILTEARSIGWSGVRAPMATDGLSGWYAHPPEGAGVTGREAHATSDNPARSVVDEQARPRHEDR